MFEKEHEDLNDHWRKGKKVALLRRPVKRGAKLRKKV
jgi:hypothetical protein